MAAVLDLREPFRILRLLPAAHRAQACTTSSFFLSGFAYALRPALQSVVPSRARTPRATLPPKCSSLTHRLRPALPPASHLKRTRIGNRQITPTTTNSVRQNAKKQNKKPDYTSNPTRKTSTQRKNISFRFTNRHFRTNSHPKQQFYYEHTVTRRSTSPDQNHRRPRHRVYLRIFRWCRHPYFRRLSHRQEQH